MTTPQPPSVFGDRAFLILVVAVSLAFALIVSPFAEAAFWAAVLAVLFARTNREFANLTKSRSLAALVTVVLIVLIVILPAAAIATLLIQQGSSVYERIQAGDLSFAGFLQQLLAVLPTGLAESLKRFGLTNLSAIEDPLSAGLSRALQFLAANVLTFGQRTFDAVLNFFIMLYLLFFFLRDGAGIGQRIRAAAPLREELLSRLMGKFKNVVRATMKGNLVIAVVQGALGGLIFWILGIQAAAFWAVVMAFLSLLPVVGTALIWVPAALYFLATGALWRGAILIAFGILVIGLVDNLLRPVLVGKETKMPDYIVLVATLGGIAFFGIVGFILGPLIAALFIAVWDVVARQETDVVATPAAPSQPGGPPSRSSNGTS